MARIPILTAILLFPLLTGCLVMGYSPGGGWHLWPGSIGITLILIALMLYLNRR